MSNENKTIAIIGLGYVGLPLAVEFGKTINTIGFDIYESRINELKSGFDRTLETDKTTLLAAEKLQLTHLISDLKSAASISSRTS
jgi:UDP-N-acetyl-D-galactosamine dehydrogenase